MRRNRCEQRFSPVHNHSVRQSTYEDGQHYDQAFLVHQGEQKSLHEASHIDVDTSSDTPLQGSTIEQFFPNRGQEDGGGEEPKSCEKR